MNGRGDLIGTVLAGDADQIRPATEWLSPEALARAPITRRARRSTLLRSFSECGTAMRSSFQRNSSSKSPGTFGDTPS